MSTLLNNADASPNTGNPKPGGATSFAGQSTKSSSWASATSNGSRTGSQTGGASSTSASAPDRPANNGFGLWNNSSSPSDNKGSKPPSSSSSSSSHSVAQTSVDNPTTSTSTTSSNRPSTWNNSPPSTTLYTTKVSSTVSQSTTAISTHIKVHSTPECPYGPSDEESVLSSPISRPPHPSTPHHHSQAPSSSTQTSGADSGAATHMGFSGSSSAHGAPTTTLPPSNAGTGPSLKGDAQSSTVNSSSGDVYGGITGTSSTSRSTSHSWYRPVEEDQLSSSLQLTTAYTISTTLLTTSVSYTIPSGPGSGSMIATQTTETLKFTLATTYTPFSTPTANGSTSPPNKNNLGPLVGGIVGAVVALILLSFTICFVLRRKRRLRDQEYTAPLSPGPDTATIRDMHQFAATPVLVPAESPFADIQGSDYESTEYYSDARQSVDSLFTSQVDLAASSHGFLPSDVAFPTLEEVGRAVEYPYINAPRRIVYSDTTSAERSTTSINSFSTFTPVATENPFIGEDHGAQTPTLDISSERPSLARTWSDQQRVAASWAAALAAASPVDPKDVSDQYMTNPFIDPSEDGHSIKTTSTDDSLQTTLQAQPVELHRNRLSSASSGIDIPSDPSQCGIAL
ncbi:hypothetical protein BJ138DRAFT_1212903 [Hygrophoropsis aurantiaca]|uniref:Uncharacterized protein n=1 Tax=Hygrophoropsis aurantiaca TaxID=72124 RepID=A0ACB8A2J0_9AGAM|nr:hypothetical protein BJ138DRAFT_1212903 [Hygrophoropsis aurantiaca]